jgi:hypothetical protein
MVGWKRRYGAKASETATNNAIEKRGRFFNNSSEFEGIKFDSDYELQVYKKLLNFVKLGYIKSVVAHPPSIEVVPKSEVEVQELQKRTGAYKTITRTLFNNTDFNPDFLLTLNSGKEVYLDAKSYATLTDAYKIKIKLLYQLQGLICVTAFKQHVDNFEILIKALNAGAFLQFFNKSGNDRYFKDLHAGRFKI